MLYNKLEGGEKVLYFYIDNPFLSQVQKYLRKKRKPTSEPVTKLEPWTWFNSSGSTDAPNFSHHSENAILYTFG